MRVRGWAVAETTPHAYSSPECSACVLYANAPTAGHLTDIESAAAHSRSSGLEFAMHCVCWVHSCVTHIFVFIGWSLTVNQLMSVIMYNRD